MAESICNGNHKYGLWDNNSRTCYKCGHVEILPMDNDIKKENLMQEKAKAILEHVLTIENTSLDAVKYIYNVLNDYLYYLDIDSLSQFQDKVKMVGIGNNLNELSVGCILNYIESFKNHKITNEIEDSFDEFKIMFLDEINELLEEKERKAML